VARNSTRYMVFDNHAMRAAMRDPMLALKTGQ
jgi:hypothetical protein